MPKYSQIYWKDLVRVLKKHWFIEHSWTGSHCTMKNIHSFQRVTIPVHNKPIWKWLLTAILRQLKMDKSILDE